MSRFTSRCSLGLLCTIALATVWSSAAPASAQESSLESQDSIVSESSIEALVRDLGSDSYQLREAASVRLIEIGAPAIDQLAEAAISDESEIAWRATDVLEQIGMRGSEAALVRVASQMNRLSESGRPDLARRSATLRQKWKRARTERAVARLQTMGAQVSAGGYYGGGLRIDGDGRFIGGGIPIALADDGGIRVFRGGMEAVDMDVAAALDRIVMEDGTVRAPTPDDFDEQTEELEDLAAENPRHDLIDEPRRQRLAEFQAQVTEVLGERLEVTGGEQDESEKTAEEEAFERALDVARQKLDDPFVPLDIPVLPQIEEDPAFEEMARVAEVRAIEIAMGEPVAFGGFGGVVPVTTQGEIQVARSITLNQNWTGGAEGLRLLNEIENVTSVSLNSIEVTPEMLIELSMIETLSQISIMQCKFDTNQVKAFMRLKPNVAVSARGSALLGINANLTNVEGQSGCVITNVMDGSGAKAAGILMGDIVVRIDDQPITDFVALTLSIANREIGDKVEVEVLRGDEKHVLQVKLGSSAGIVP